MTRRLLRPAVVVIVLVFGLAGSAAVAHAQNPPETIEYYATDALGSVRIVFTATGQVIGRSDYLPFGDTKEQSGMLPRQRFTGQERDGVAGLDDFNARSLQMRTGRMNRPDPVFWDVVGDPQAWNRYAYVQNRPLVFTDPSGLCPTCPVFRSGVTVTLPKLPPAEIGVGGAAWGGDGEEQAPGFGERPEPEESGGGAGSGQPPPPSADKKKPPAENRGCPPAPQGPPGVSVDRNITIARRMRIVTYVYPLVSLYAYSQMVGNKKPWDYKQLGSDFQPFGNFNFGAAGAAWGIPLNVLQRGAGYAQSKAGTSAAGWGQWYLGAPYGDDPIDQAQMIAGYLYYQYGCYAHK
jgi:RHS repeat-associated protein